MFTTLTYNQTLVAEHLIERIVCADVLVTMSASEGTMLDDRPATVEEEVVVASMLVDGLLDKEFFYDDDDGLPVAVLVPTVFAATFFG